MSEIETLPFDVARCGVADEAMLLVDIRDVRELEREGRIPGAFHAPRGMLEFRIDPESPYHKAALATDRKLVLFCASAWSSALSRRPCGIWGCLTSPNWKVVSPTGATAAARSSASSSGNAADSGHPQNRRTCRADRGGRPVRRNNPAPDSVPTHKPRSSFDRSRPAGDRTADP